MKKNIILSIVIVLLILGLGITPIADGQTVTSSESPFSSMSTIALNKFQSLLGSLQAGGDKRFGNGNDTYSITPEDEGDHFPCGYELWCFHATLELENGDKWDSAATFVYFMNKTRRGYATAISWCRVRHWNRQTNEFFDNFQYDDFPGGPFETEKNEVNLTYYNSTAKGLYPNYSFYCEDDENQIITDIHCKAISSPCWLFQEPAGREVPWGLSGTGRAYFIPIMEVNGTISIDGVVHNVTGFLYFEHDFAFIDFMNPANVYSLKELRKGLKLLRSSGRWWLFHTVRNLPRKAPSYHRSNDYLFGWCWCWVIFDNGWSAVVFRPTILGISRGRVLALLYFSKDGQNYSEMGSVYWDNTKEKYIERGDIYIPVDFEITAIRDDVELHIKFNATTDITELFSDEVTKESKAQSCTFYNCGTVKGYYEDDDEHVDLNGSYAIEQSRWLSKVTKHRSVDIEPILPPNGIGFTFRAAHHTLRIEKFLKIQFRPFDFVFYIKPAPGT